MSTIHHCGKVRRGKSYWLKPNSIESQFYRHVVLVCITCRSCGQFIMEWHGIDLFNQRTPQNRVALKRQSEWILRSEMDIDTTMDNSQWASIKSGVCRVQTSLRVFPWTQYWTSVR